MLDGGLHDQDVADRRAELKHSRELRRAGKMTVYRADYERLQAYEDAVMGEARSTHTITQKVPAAQQLKKIIDWHKSNAGGCKFNCRTAKQNWIEGYRWAALVYDADMRDPGRSLTEEAENEWKRRQETETKSRQKRLRVQLGSNLRREGGGSNRVPKV